MSMTDRRHRRPGGRAVAAGAAAAWALMAILSPSGVIGQVEQKEPNRGGTIDLASRDVNVALERIQAAPGYEVNLFASEQQFPELANPLAMTFDSRGRLWVLTSPTYPHYFPGEPPDDKLVILEDTDEDGRADALTVFADGLYMPMGFELGDGGAYVSQQPNLMFLRDTDGDDRADERAIILHGFGTEDSHHAIHAFTWGPGGGLYFQEGTFLHSQVETPHGPVRVENAAVFRYEPRTEELGVFVSYGFANPWGHVIDRWGQNFVADASNGNNYYGTAFSGHVDYPRKQRPMKEWTLTKVRPTAGVEFIRSRHFPESAQGNFLINNVIGFHGTKQYRVTEEGSGSVAVEIEPLLQSTDTNFRPVALQFGPDGALYVVDWFNPLIGHMQFSLRDPRRDRTHGRIWRVTAKGRPLLERPRIHGQPIEAQLELLKAYEDRTRYWTRIELRSQPTDDVVPALRTWVSRLDQDHPDYQHHLLEALWVFQHHDVVERRLLDQLLKADDFRARAAAVRVLQHWFDRVDDGVSLLAEMVRDPAPRVRLEAVRALSFVPTVEAAEAALEVLRQETDYYLQYVLDSTITTLDKAWKPALSAGRAIAADHPEGLTYLLTRMSPAELTALPRSEPVFHELLRRAGVEFRVRRDALDGLAGISGTSVVQELIAAIERLDGMPGTSAAARDLAQMLTASDAAALSSARTELEHLALRGRTARVRQGAWAALMRADGSVERAWRQSAASPRQRVDLLNGIPLLEDQALLTALYPHVTRVAAGLKSAAGRKFGPPGTPTAPAAGGPNVSSATPAHAPGITGRYIRITAPGRSASLGLAEVEVRRGGRNVASAATASQSSTVSGGAIGGHARNAIDGRTGRGADGSGVAFTSEEQDPWWELDLGAEVAIDAVSLRPYDTGRGSPDAGLHLSVLDAAREPVFVEGGLSATEEIHVLDLGGDYTGRLRTSAIAALAHVPGHEEQTVTLLASLVREGTSRAAAIDTLGDIPLASWPKAEIAPLAESLLAYARTVPAGDRTGAEFRRAVALGRDLTAALPSPDGARLSRGFDEVSVRTIRIQAVVAQMRFDITQFTVAPGEDVEIVFVNPDHMPHNLLIVAPGAMEDVSLKAEAMAATPDGFQEHFVPDTPAVLHATKLIDHDEIARLRFTAPADTGSYPYVCTFPGHWRRMNGVMDVRRPPTPTEEQ